MLRALRDKLIVLETWLAAASLLLLLLLVAAQAVARNLFDTGFASFDQIARYLVLYVAFLGATLAVERGRHIRIDALNVMLPRAVKHAMVRPLNAIAALVCGLLAYAALRFWRDEWSYAADAERWMLPIELIIPVGFTLLMVHFALAGLTGGASQTDDHL